jgi:hypothetical protein
MSRKTLRILARIGAIKIHPDRFRSPARPDPQARLIDQGFVCLCEHYDGMSRYNIYLKEDNLSLARSEAVTVSRYPGRQMWYGVVLRRSYVWVDLDTLAVDDRGHEYFETPDTRVVFPVSGRD